MTDEFFMKEAIKEARKAFMADEVPVGAVIVHNQKIIARGYNQVELLKDATAHAEMIAIGAASQALDNWRLIDSTMYCTLEPCLMCAGALLLSRVTRLVWGAPDIRHGANGSLMDIFTIKHPTHQLTITSGVLAQECAALMTEFFHARRKNIRKNID
jgi:tRNA(adenine34) deaminase